MKINNLHRQNREHITGRVICSLFCLRLFIRKYFVCHDHKAGSRIAVSDSGGDHCRTGCFCPDPVTGFHNLDHFWIRGGQYRNFFCNAWPESDLDLLPCVWSHSDLLTVKLDTGGFRTDIDLTV